MFQLGMIASAVGKNPGTLKVEVERYDVLYPELGDRDAQGPGRVRLFSFETAMGIAIAAQLSSRCFMPPYWAYAAAEDFILGHESGADYHTRRAGRPYDLALGDTFLLICRAGIYLVLANDAEDPCSAAIARAGMPREQREAYIALNISRIYTHLVDKLGGDPSDSLAIS